jgi:hypothetical protein
MTFGYRLSLAYAYQDSEARFSIISPIIPIPEVYNQYFFQIHYGVELILETSIPGDTFIQKRYGRLCGISAHLIVTFTGHIL